MADLFNSTPTLPTVEENMRKLLDLIGVEFRPCKACQAQLVFVVHRRTGAKTPYTYDGLNHFINCPDAKQFKRGPHAK